MQIHRYLNSDKPVAIAHRGGSYLGSENTMEAFENAINMGFKFLETSAKESINVDDAFITMTKEIKKRAKVIDDDDSTTHGHSTNP